MLSELRITQWNGLDWTLVLILVTSLAVGYWRGVVRTLLGLLGLVCGFLLAQGNYLQLGSWIHDRRWIHSAFWAGVIAFVLLFALAVAGAQLVARIMHSTIRKSGLGYVDRVLGGAFGLLRGGVIVVALLIIPTTFAAQSKLVATSILSPYFLGVAHDVSFLLPRSLRFA
ncbi:MAG: CvpA family protein [Acidobacteriota bacterium]|nr:CvpA family protein [Acidobacteriota bacterium]